MVDILHTSNYSTVFSEASSPWSCYKRYYKTPLEERHWLNIKRECRILSRLHEARTKGVVQLIRVADSPLYLDLQFKRCLGGNLYCAIQGRQYCDEATLCQKVIAPLLHVLSNLHAMGVIHRDIKPENIFLEADGQVVLGDFGLAVDVNMDRPCSRVGTEGYMAPEVSAQPSAVSMAHLNIPRAILRSYTSAVDIWALGVLIHEALTGCHPFPHEYPICMAWKAEFWPAIRLPDNISQECQHFVDLALEKSAEKRPTAASLLLHPWIQKHTAPAKSDFITCHIRPPTKKQAEPPSTVVAEKMRLSSVDDTIPPAHESEVVDKLQMSTPRPGVGMTACKGDVQQGNQQIAVYAGTSPRLQYKTGHPSAAESAAGCRASACSGRDNLVKAATSAFDQRSVTIDSPEGIANQRSSAGNKLSLFPALSEPVLLEASMCAAPPAATCLVQAPTAAPESLGGGVARPAESGVVAIGSPSEIKQVGNRRMLRGSSRSHAICPPAYTISAGSPAAGHTASEAGRPVVPPAAAVAAMVACRVPPAGAYAAATAAAVTGAQNINPCGLSGIQRAQRAGLMFLQSNKFSSAFLQKLRGSAVGHSKCSVDIVCAEGPVLELEQPRDAGMRLKWGFRTFKCQEEVNCTDTSDTAVSVAPASSLLSPNRGGGKIVKDLCSKIIQQLLSQGPTSQPH